MQLPKSLLDSLQEVEGFNEDAFIKVHASGEQVTSIRINPVKVPGPGSLSFTENLGSAIPWTEYGFYLNQRPSFTFDPFFHAGCYYVQEASGMFLEQAISQTVDLSRSLKLLDLSAAPGGKSTHIQSLISKDSLLVSNEVIRSRANVLKDNIIKWGSENVVVTNNDPRDFAGMENYFDVIVVDAPCSGSGLFRRDPGAIDEWSLNNVALCSQRQQRILADVWPALKTDGILIYSTCSYSKEEDEEIIEWLMKEFSAISLQLKIENYPGIVETQPSGGRYGYRFFPDKIKGEGFFLTCFKKQDGGEYHPGKPRFNADLITKAESSILEKWVRTGGYQFIKNENTVYAWRANLVNDMNYILSNLRVIYSGVRAGELIRDKLVPDHALAMSKLHAQAIEQLRVSEEQAIYYLQKKDIGAKPRGKGWQLVNYEGVSLGWINVLPGRINNYYPKELRILKDSKQ